MTAGPITVTATQAHLDPPDTDGTPSQAMHLTADTLDHVRDWLAGHGWTWTLEQHWDDEPVRVENPHTGLGAYLPVNRWIVLHHQPYARTCIEIVDPDYFHELYTQQPAEEDAA